jgi:hypothetical protein
MKRARTRAMRTALAGGSVVLASLVLMAVASVPAQAATGELTTTEIDNQSNVLGEQTTTFKRSGGCITAQGRINERWLEIINDTDRDVTVWTKKWCQGTKVATIRRGKDTKIQTKKYGTFYILVLTG